MGQSKYGIMFGEMSNGGHFITGQGMLDLEREAPGGEAGAQEQQISAMDAIISQSFADLEVLTSSSAVEHNMHGTAWTLLNAISGSSGSMAAILADLGPVASQIGVYVTWASGTANS
jgi:hypothetical protein